MPSSLRNEILVALASLSAEDGASASSSASCYDVTKDVGIFPVVMSELKLSKIERQVTLTDMMEAAHNPALQERPERINILRVNFAANIFTSAMPDGFMRILVVNQAIAGVLIGRYEVNSFRDGLANEPVQRAGVRI